MGYKKIKLFGCDNTRKYGKYLICYYDKDTQFSTVNRGSVLLSVISKTCGKGTWLNGICTASYKNELRKIYFDIESRSIIVESRWLDKKRFKKYKHQITNKEFFNYVHNNVEKLFGYLYDVTPNMNRTVFKLKKNDNGFSITKD